MTRLWAPPAPTELVTAGGAAAALGIAPKLGRRLVLTGLLGQAAAMDETGRSWAGERAALDVLRQRPLLDPADSRLPVGVVVKMGEPRPAGDDDREWIGWHASMPEEVVEAATARWWPIANPTDLIGDLLVVSVATVVVRVRRVAAVREANGRVALSTEPAPPSFLDGARLAVRPGGLTERIGR